MTKKTKVLGLLKNRKTGLVDGKECIYVQDKGMFQVDYAIKCTKERDDLIDALKTMIESYLQVVENGQQSGAIQYARNILEKVEKK